MTSSAWTQYCSRDSYTFSTPNYFLPKSTSFSPKKNQIGPFRFSNIERQGTWNCTDDVTITYHGVFGTNVFSLLKGTHPTDFCKKSVRRSKYCLEFLITWGRLNLLDECSIQVQFSKLKLTYSLRFSEFNFSYFTLQVKLFFIEKKKPKISGFKNIVERGIRKILTFELRQIFEE